MKKMLFVLIMVAISVSMVSCGNKTDRALDKLEKGVNKGVTLCEKAMKEKDPKLLKEINELAEELRIIDEELNKAEFTEEQKNRYDEIMEKNYSVDPREVQEAIEEFPEDTDYN